jgi:hypothetical protein
MRFHDFHLSGYTVSDFGGTITLHLVFDYPELPKQKSHIRFSDVAAYDFVHTGGAIITGIDEVSLEGLLASVGNDLVEWWRLHGGYAHWRDDPAEYLDRLQAANCKAWLLTSAIGFGGFVIAYAIGEVEAS